MTQKLIIKVFRRRLLYRLNNHECLSLSWESPNPLIIPTVNLWTFFNSSQSLTKVLFVFANLAAYMAWEWVFHSNSFVPARIRALAHPSYWVDLNTWCVKRFFLYFKNKESFVLFLKSHMNNLKTKGLSITICSLCFQNLYLAEHNPLKFISGPEGHGKEWCSSFFLGETQSTSRQGGVHRPGQVNSEHSNCHGLGIKSELGGYSLLSHTPMINSKERSMLLWNSKI